MGNYVSSPFGSVISLYQVDATYTVSTEGPLYKMPYHDELGVIVLQEWVDLNHDGDVEPCSKIEDHQEERVEESKETYEEKEEKTVESMIPITPLKLSANQRKRQRRQYV